MHIGARAAAPLLLACRMQSRSQRHVRVPPDAYRRPVANGHRRESICTALVRRKLAATSTLRGLRKTHLPLVDQLEEVAVVSGQVQAGWESTMGEPSSNCSKRQLDLMPAPAACASLAVERFFPRSCCSEISGLANALDKRLHWGTALGALRAPSSSAGGHGTDGRRSRCKTSRYYTCVRLVVVPIVSTLCTAGCNTS